VRDVPEMNRSTTRSQMVSMARTCARQRGARETGLGAQDGAAPTRARATPAPLWRRRPSICASLLLALLLLLLMGLMLIKSWLGWDEW
jgi:hypothetical protein